MKRLLPLLLALILAAPGCGIIPKRVELFQKKVQTFPEAKPRETEAQRQAAALASQEAQQTLVAAVEEGASTNVVRPASNTAVLTRSVSTSLGPPAKPWSGDVNTLATKVDSSTAALNSRIDQFAAKNDDVAGKKIEGTGLFQIPYFVWLGIVAAGLVLLLIALAVGWTILKVYALTNPIAGAALGAAGLAGSLLHKGFNQVVSGGEAFKEQVSKTLEPAIAQKVLELFCTEQMKAQDEDVQVLVKKA